MFKLLLFIVIGQAYAAQTVVGCASPGNGSAAFETTQITGSRTWTTGNAIVVFGGNFGNTLNSVVDSGGVNTYTGDTEQARNYNSRQFWSKNITGFTGTVTVNKGNGQFGFIIACEVSGSDLTSPLDVTNKGDAGFDSTPYTTPMFSTSTINNIVFVGVSGAFATGYSAGTGYTIPANGSVFNAVGGGALEYQVFSSVQTNITADMNMTVTPNDTEGSVISLKAASSTSIIQHKITID